MVAVMTFPVGFAGENSPDNWAHNPSNRPAKSPGKHTVLPVGTPKMPGEPKRVQPSRDTDLNRGNRRR
jgi:hypothetical protein